MSINPHTCPHCGLSMQPIMSRDKMIGYGCPDRECGVASIGVPAVEAYIKTQTVHRQQPMMAAD